MKDNMTDFEHIRRRVSDFDRKAKVIWAIELLACAGIITVIMLAWLVWLPTKELNPLFHLGILAMVASCLFIAGKIYLNRKVSTVDDWTLSAKLNIQIEKREKDAKLLRTVGYWYLSPLFAAVILSSYGGYAQRTGSFVPDIGLWTYWAVCLVLYIGIYFFNQYQVKTKVHPILNELRALKRELES